MLRRSLHKILSDLDGAIQRAEFLSSSIAAPSSKRRKTADGPAKAVKQPELDRVIERATWVKDILEFRAYEYVLLCLYMSMLKLRANGWETRTFTQLIADKQFGQLGLVLIGALAQVGTAISPFVKEQRPPEPEPEPELEPAPGNEREARAAKSVQGPGADARGEAVPRADFGFSAVANGGDELDVGVAVSRDELEDHPLQPSIERESSPVHSVLSAREGRHLAKVKRNKLKKSKSDCPESTEGDGEPTDVGLKEADRAKKKKKRKKGGDEFDDLFSSLL